MPQIDNEVYLDVMIWTGLSIAILKVIDWLLAKYQKNWITDKAETAWLWLADQRAGRFTKILLSKRTQMAFVILAHLLLITIVSLFVGRTYFGLETGAFLLLGHPRVYLFQVLVDVAALVGSAILLTFTVHPRIASWIGSSRSLWLYFGRCAVSVIPLIGLAILYVIATSQIHELVPKPEGGFIDSGAISEAYENVYFGLPGVTVLHGITAAVSAPILAELLILLTMLFLSFYWLIAVVAVMLLFRTIQFVLLRIVESPNGPVLGITGALIGIGGIAKFLST